MVNDIDYERRQLEIIALEYKVKGFDVHFDSPLPFPSAMLDFRYDAVAYRRDDNELVIIELVSAGRDLAGYEKRLESLELIAREFPRATVDFRYIDRDTIALAVLRENKAVLSIRGDLEKLTRARLNRPNPRKAPQSGYLVEYWTMHTLIIRSFSAFIDIDGVNSLSVLDLYNKLIADQHIVPPESRVDGLERDLFELHEFVQGAVQGLDVEFEVVSDMRLHVLEMRRQVRRAIHK